MVVPSDSVVNKMYRKGQANISLTITAFRLAINWRHLTSGDSVLHTFFFQDFLERTNHTELPVIQHICMNNSILAITTTDYENQSNKQLYNGTVGYAGRS